MLEEALKLGAEAVGGIPHFEYTREYGIESLKTVFDLAGKYDRLIDIHCDEIDDDQSRFVETVATLALERAMGQRVTASHTTAMHSYSNAYVVKLMRLLKNSGIHFIANPVTNLNLQGRMDSYPKRRGLRASLSCWKPGLTPALVRTTLSISGSPCRAVICCWCCSPVWSAASSPALTRLTGA